MPAALEKHVLYVLCIYIGNFSSIWFHNCRNYL